MNATKRALLFLLLSAGSAVAQYPQAHSGWKLVPGGENLIAKGYWGSVIQEIDGQWITAPADATLAVSNGTLQATAHTNYFSSPDSLGPWLYTSGDFGAIATIQTAPAMDTLINLTGSMATGSQFWQGNTRLEYGVDSAGDYVLDYWDGTASSPVFYRTFKSGSGAPASGSVTIELLRQSGQFSVYFNGVPYGPIPDPGLFAAQYIMPGFTLAPGQQLQITQFAFEVPQSDTTAQLIEPVGVVPFTHSGDSLGSLAAAAGRTFSVQANPEQLTLGKYAPTSPGGTPDLTLQPKVIGEYSGIVAAEMYYFKTEPTQGQLVFDTGDALIATAKAAGRPVHCHHLIGGANSYSPYWLTNGTWTKDQLTEIMLNHIQALVTHYQGQCRSWDVVNEALDSNGNLRTDNIWEQVIGPAWVDMAFQAARQADPQAKLYYNEYDVENATPKATGLYNLVSGMKQRGIPIDGVGLQCHWTPESADYIPNHDQMVANMAKLATLGLSVRISELDDRLKLPASTADLNTQATYFSTTVQACLDSPNCVEITMFGVDDVISWIPEFFPGYGAATMFDASYNPKPAYTAAMNTLRAAPKAKSAITSVHTASGGTDMAQNTFIEIKGVNLVPSTTPAAGVIWSNAPDFAAGKMPTQLNGVSVTVNGKAAFVYFYCSAATSPVCAADQINVLTPLDSTVGPVPIVVTNGTAATSSYTANLKAVVPTLLLFNALGPVVATHADYSLAGALNLYPGYTTPAKPGETVLVYGIGFGLPTNALTNGSSSQSGSLPSVPSCQVGGLPAGVSAALVGPGLYQLNLTIPSNAPNGDNPVACTYDGATTAPGAFITVQQ